MQATTSRPSRKGRPPITFRCELVYGADRYTLAPIADVHPEIAIRAFQMRKNDGPDVYDVRLTTEGYAECDCKGFQRWHGCKHVLMLAALGCLPVTAVQKANVPESELATSRHRSAADLARNDPAAYARLRILWVDPRECPPQDDHDDPGRPEAPLPTDDEIDAMADYYGAD